jgi:hypothetical protein
MQIGVNRSGIRGGPPNGEGTEFVAGEQPRLGPAAERAVGRYEEERMAHMAATKVWTSDEVQRLA